jgi:amino acid permease
VSTLEVSTLTSVKAKGEYHYILFLIRVIMRVAFISHVHPSCLVLILGLMEQSMKENSETDSMKVSKILHSAD